MAEVAKPDPDKSKHDAGPAGGDWGPTFFPDDTVYTTSVGTGIGTRIAVYILGGSILAVVVCAAAWLCAAILSTVPSITR